MLNITEEQKTFLRENFRDAEKMMASDAVNDVLLPLDTLITYQGFDSEYMLTAWGNKAQRIYDDIYAQNEE